MPLLNTCVDEVGAAALATLEVADDVNTFVTAVLLAVDHVLMLRAAADADMEKSGPPVSTPLAANLQRALSLSCSSEPFPTVTFLVSQGYTTTPAGVERDIFIRRHG